REFIRKMAVEYFQEGLKSAFKALGGDPEKLQFILASDFYHNNDKFWETVVSVGKHTTLSRMQRSITIMGKKEGSEVDFAKLLYPAMQVADVFALEKNIAHAGIDQRKAHVIARDVALKDENLEFEHNGEKYKPIAIHHPLILGLSKPAVWPLPEGANIKDVLGEMKMSKSVANSAIFIHDSEDEIRSKMKKAFCPEKETVFNPVLDWADKLIFKGEDKEVSIKRDEKFGGELQFKNYAELEEVFAKGDLHPMDLKSFVADYLVEVLAPIRADFSEGKLKEALAELESRL
ncbi:MAG: tyrosine--tRNA ligase, partial [Nanoarchaeota archaeon]